MVKVMPFFFKKDAETGAGECLVLGCTHVVGRYQTEECLKENDHHWEGVNDLS